MDPHTIGDSKSVITRNLNTQCDLNLNLTKTYSSDGVKMDYKQQVSNKDNFNM